VATKRRFLTTLAANENNPDVTPGDLRIAPIDGFIQLAATSNTPNAVEANLSVMGVNVFVDGLLSVEVAAGRGPIIPDNVLITEVILAGQSLNLGLRNITAGVVTAVTDLEYLSAA